MTEQKARITKSFEFPGTTIEFWDNGIVFYKISDNYEVQLEDSIRNSQVMLDNPPVGFKKYLVLVVPGEKSTVTKEAREHSQKSKAHALTQAMAVVSKSLPQRIIVNFLFRYFKMRGVYVKLFSEKEKAIEWLMSFERE